MTAHGSRGRHPSTGLALVIATVGALAAACTSPAGTTSAANTEAGNSEAANSAPTASPRVLFFDDFTGGSLDRSKWFPGLFQIGRDNNGAVPENLSVHTIDDNGQTISVLDAQANGHDYDGPVRGVRLVDKSFPTGDPRAYQRQPTGQLTGGVVWTNERFGGGRYEVRMKALPRSGGCSCMWNYYDPDAPVLPQPAQGGSYTEIDIELPAHSGPNTEPATTSQAAAARTAGFNTFVAPTDASASLQRADLGFSPGDRFHVYRWDWYDGSSGPKKVEFYVDDVLRATTSEHVPTTPAQLWVGNWPAPWSGDFRYDSQHQYIDWVKITELG